MLYDKKTCLSGNPPPQIKSNAEMLELKEFYQVRSILASVEEIERRVKERKKIILYVCRDCVYVCVGDAYICVQVQRRPEVRCLPLLFSTLLTESGSAAELRAYGFQLL